MGGGKADKALAALGAEGPFEEIQLASGAGELAAAGRLGIFLSHQIQLHAAVDADEMSHAAHALGGVDVVYVGRVEEIWLGVQPVVELLRSHGQVPGTESAVKLFFLIVQLPGPSRARERRR